MYNRANSAIYDRYGAALQGEAQVKGVTRQLAYEKLTKDVAMSLAPGTKADPQEAKDALQIASLTYVHTTHHIEHWRDWWLTWLFNSWTPETQIVRRLASRGIRLLRTDWESEFKHQIVKTWPADPKYGVEWMTNVKLEKR